MFLSTNVDIATLAKGDHRRVLKVNVDIGDSNVDVCAMVARTLELLLQCTKNVEFNFKIIILMN